MARPSKLRVLFWLAVPAALTAYAVWKLRAWQQREVAVVEREIAAIPAVEPAPRLPALPRESKPGAPDPARLRGEARERVSGVPLLAGRALTLEGRASKDGAIAPEDGTLELELHLLDGGEAWSARQKLAVLGGRWLGAFELPRDARLSDLRWSARALELGGTPVRDPLVLSDGLEAPRTHALPDTGFVVLRGVERRPTRVEVVALESGARLGEIEVRRHDPEARDGGRARALAVAAAPDDDAEELPLASTRSPIELEGAGVRLYWIRAPGRAWSRLAVDHDRGGERRVALAAGGELEVRFERWSDDWGLDLRVRERASGRLVARARPRLSGITTISGLAPGAYRLAVELGGARAHDRPIVVEARDVEVAAGRTAVARIAFSKDLDPVPVPLRGTLVASEGWSGVAGLELLIRPLAAAPYRGGAPFRARVADLRRLEGASAGARTWDAGEVAPGRYLAELVPLRAWTTIDVGAKGSIFTAIDPLPKEWTGARLVLEDPASGKPTPVRWLLWRRAEGEPEGVPPYETLAPTQPDRYFVSAPPGDLRLAAIAAEHRYALEPSTARASGSSDGRTLRVLPCARLELALREGGVPVPADPRWLDGVEVRRLQEGVAGEPLAWPWTLGRSDLYAIAGERAWGSADPLPRARVAFDVDRPGEHEVTFPPIAGFEPIEPRRVTLAREAPVEVVVELVPAR